MWYKVLALVSMVALAVAVVDDCSDGIYCNGAERLINGECVSLNDNPCDDGFACSVDICSEENGGKCSYILSPSCPTCSGERCVADCAAAECGDDGCNGFCGQCADGESCVRGECVVGSDSDGTCASPLELNVTLGTFEVVGNTSNGLNTMSPACNWLSGAQEIFYRFEVTSDMSPLGYEFTSTGFDTVLQVVTDCTEFNRDAVVACADDSTPPGNYGSRVSGVLETGVYFVMVDGFNAEEHGEFTLRYVFTDGCEPLCDGNYCGDNGCNGTCGTCEAGEICSMEKLRCYPNPCDPDCVGRACGPDGCGGHCGECAENSYCLYDVVDDEYVSTGECSPVVVPCNSTDPDCGTCGPTEFCNSQCACEDAGADMPDLFMDDYLSFAEDMHIEEVAFASSACAIVEACVRGPGVRRLLRFDVVAVNQGKADFIPPDPKDQPELYEYGECHGHMHFGDFADYYLYDESGVAVLEGIKQGFCMEDTLQVIHNPAASCQATYECGNQGMSRGWGDVYGATIDCQWMDITDLPAGRYTLHVTLNPKRRFDEYSFSNNDGWVDFSFTDDLALTVHRISSDAGRENAPAKVTMTFSDAAAANFVDGDLVQDVVALTGVAAERVAVADRTGTTAAVTITPGTPVSAEMAAKHLAGALVNNTDLGATTVLHLAGGNTTSIILGTAALPGGGTAGTTTAAGTTSGEDGEEVTSATALFGTAQWQVVVPCIAILLSLRQWVV